MRRFRVLQLDGRTAVALAVAAWLLIAEACGPVYAEPCTQADVEKIVAAHESRLASLCIGQGANCADRKKEDARFREELRTWVRCDKEPPR